MVFDRVKQRYVEHNDPWELLGSKEGTQQDIDA